MKILVVTEVFYPENGLVNDFALELKARGHHVDVLTSHPSYPLGKIFPGYENVEYFCDQWEGIDIHRFRFVEGYRESKIRKIRNYHTFVRQGKKVGLKIGGGYDHIIVYQTGPLTVALPAVAIKKRHKVPVTIWTFDIWPDAVYTYGFPRIWPANAFLDRLIMRVYRSADHILVSSAQFRESVKAYVPDREIHYAPNWLIPEKEEPSSLRLDPTVFNFTFTGNISMAQNLENVLSGWKLADLRDSVLNIVGDGSSFEALRAKIEKEGIRGVILHGRFPSDQIQDILGQSRMLVLPLVSGGIEKTEPYKLQSYLKAGKPILGILNGSAQEIINDNGLGICALPDDIREIADAFAKAPEFAKENSAQIADNAGKLLKMRFNRERIIDSIMSVIENRS